jgi:hypothetical protein
MRRETALNLALRRGYMRTVLELVRAGADVCCKDQDGYVLGPPHEPCTQHSCLAVRCEELCIQPDGAARVFRGRADVQRCTTRR